MRMTANQIDAYYAQQERELAWQAAEFRKLSPESFDLNGNIITGQLPVVLQRFAERHPDKALR